MVRRFIAVVETLSVDRYQQIFRAGYRDIVMIDH